MHHTPTSRFHGLAAMMLLGVLWPGLSWAQGTVAVDVGENPRESLTARPPLPSDAPDLRALQQNTLRPPWPARAQPRGSHPPQIVRFKKLLKSLPKDHVDRPGLLFELAGLLEDKSQHYRAKARRAQDDCARLGGQSDEVARRTCSKRVERNTRESKAQRRATHALYTEILKNFPTYKHIEHVHIHFGLNLMEAGARGSALSVFKMLVKNHPTSPFVPNALVAIGDGFQDAGEPDQALRTYERAVRAYKTPLVYGYATYQMARCALGLGQYAQALGLFVRTFEHATKHEKLQTSAALRRLSRGDIVATYAYVGRPSKAVGFFKKVVGKKGAWVEMSERLARRYADQGKFGDSSVLYAQLKKLRWTSARVLGYQYEIVRNESSTNAYSKETVKHIIRLVQLVGAADKGVFKDREEHGYARRRKNIEELSRNWAHWYHREAQQTRNTDLYGAALHIYKNHLETFPKAPGRYAVAFFYAELLYKKGWWKEAAAAYDRALKLEPKGRYTEAIVRGRAKAKQRGSKP